MVAIGVSQISVNASGFEQYDAAAQEVARQVTDPVHRDMLIGCQPADAALVDDACARAFISRAGRMLYRRPMQSAEVEKYVALARLVAESKKDFHDGLAVSLTAMLESPTFLFRTERAIRKGGEFKLDDYSLASRLSFLMWNAPPDDALLSAAGNGELGTPDGQWPAAFAFSAQTEMRTALHRAFHLARSLPTFPLSEFEAEVAVLGATETERLVRQRVGQGIFRKALMDYWDGRCPLTGIAEPALLRASHIVPWAECSSDAERLDVHNGLLLAAHWDAAFDAGLVSFDYEGRVLLKPGLDAEVVALLAPQMAPPLALTDRHR